MALIIIAGPSGTGKTRSLKNLNPKETLLIKTISKPLSFKRDAENPWEDYDFENKQGNVMNIIGYASIPKIISKAKENGFKRIVIDDVGYIMTKEFMDRSSEKGYDKWTEMASHIWDIAYTSTTIGDSFPVYMVFHIEKDAQENITLKTLGKLLQEKVTLEGLATVALISDRVDGKYGFWTQNQGRDFAKSPEGMLPDQFMDNDLAIVDKAFREYYGEES